MCRLFCRKRCHKKIDMNEQRNKDLYNHPHKDEINQELRPDSDGNNAQQKIAVNPNPRANENLKDKDISTDKTSTNSQPGSEITDGEDG